jgi:hypothetical protein
MNTNTFNIRITWADGREHSFSKTTKWNRDQVRAWVVRKYNDSQYVYIT